MPHVDMRAVNAADSRWIPRDLDDVVKRETRSNRKVRCAARASSRRTRMAERCHSHPHPPDLPRQVRKDARRKQFSFAHGGECRHAATSLPLGYPESQLARTLRCLAFGASQPVVSGTFRREETARCSRDLGELGATVLFSSSDGFECELACVT